MNKMLKTGGINCKQLFAEQHITLIPKHTLKRLNKLNIYKDVCLAGCKSNHAFNTLIGQLLLNECTYETTYLKGLKYAYK